MDVAPENGDACLGMTSDNGCFYWIGMLFPHDTLVPEDFECLEIPASRYAVFTVTGKEAGELLGEDGSGLCFSEIEKQGWNHHEDGCDFDKYRCSRTNTTCENINILFECLFSINDD